MDRGGSQGDARRGARRRRATDRGQPQPVWLPARGCAAGAQVRPSQNAGLREGKGESRRPTLSPHDRRRSPFFGAGEPTASPAFRQAPRGSPAPMEPPYVPNQEVTSVISTRLTLRLRSSVLSFFQKTKTGICRERLARRVREPERPSPTTVPPPATRSRSSSVDRVPPGARAWGRRRHRSRA